MYKYGYEYTKEDFETDVDWLVGFGLDEESAKEFILGLLNSKKSFRVAKK
jgi:hypothetical protein